MSPHTLWTQITHDLVFASIPCSTLSQQQGAALHPKRPLYRCPFFSPSLPLSLSPSQALEHMTRSPSFSHVDCQRPHPGLRSHPRKANRGNPAALLLDCGFRYAHSISSTGAGNMWGAAFISLIIHAYSFYSEGNC